MDKTKIKEHIIVGIAITAVIFLFVSTFLSHFQIAQLRYEMAKEQERVNDGLEANKNNADGIRKFINDLIEQANKQQQQQKQK